MKSKQKQLPQPQQLQAQPQQLQPLDPLRRYPMEIAARCSERAEECLRLANEMVFQEHRSALRSMAVMWRELARDGDRRVPKKASCARSKAVNSNMAADTPKAVL